MNTMVPASPHTPRVPLSSIINIDSPVSMVSNSVPHSPFASSYARRLSGNENDSFHSRRSSYSNTSRRSSQRVSIGSISTIAEDQYQSTNESISQSNSSSFDTLMEQTIMGSTHTERMPSRNVITPYVDENLPTPHSYAPSRSRLSTSSYPRTPLTTVNSMPGTPMTKLTVKSFSSALRTPLGQVRNDSVNRLSPAAQRFIATSAKPTQRGTSPRNFTIHQRPHTTGQPENQSFNQPLKTVHPFDQSHDLSSKKFALHSDENSLVENMHHLSITPRNSSSSMLLSPVPSSNTRRTPHSRTPSISQFVPLGNSDIAANVRKMR